MHWCLGMYASGSTWVFNVAMQVGAVLAPDAPPVGRYITSASELSADTDSIRHSIIKTHDVDEASSECLSSLATNLLVSIRDPRDCVTSLMIYQRYPFSRALEAIENSAHACAQFAVDSRTLLLRYEAGFIEDPSTIDKIAGTFGGRLSEAEEARIFAENTRPAVEARIAAIESLPSAIRDAKTGDIVDPVTQWHRHHANRSGEIGRWRRLLTLSQAAIIEQRLGGMMLRFGYTAEVAPYTHTIGMQAVRL